MTEQTSLPRVYRFRFAINDPVYCREIEKKARVVAINIDSDGTQYRIRYFTGDEVRFLYVYDDELQAIDPE